MALEMRQNLNMRMEQKLKLTPQMIQSIAILLLPHMALEERIMTEIESNPVLEIADQSEEAERDDRQAERESTHDTYEDQVRDRFEEDRRDDYDNERFQDMLKARREARQDDDDGPDRMEAINASQGAPQSLAEHILEQLRFEDMPQHVRDIARVICWQLDDHGFLTVPLAELFEDEESLEEAEVAWEWVRGCEPIGVGARNVQECLLMQLERESGDNSFEMAVVRQHWDDLLRNRLPVIATAMGCSVERVQEAVEVISQCNPAPGAPFRRSDNHYVIPDVVIERSIDGEWLVSVPDSYLPKIEISQAYHQLYENAQTDVREKAYLKEQLGSARFLIDAIAQRKRTLLKIATEIVKHQQAFLEFGPEQLRPLMRQDIADKIGMHVATVSRAVKDKYAQTPSGTLPLARFFSGGIATQDGGEAESSRSVKLRIKALVDKEDKRHPLSDQEIADILAKEGLDISRRTVTKYRIAEDIPSTRQRRRFGD